MRKAEFICPKCKHNMAVEVCENVTSYTEFNKIDLDAMNSDGVLNWYGCDDDHESSVIAGYECDNCGLWLGATYDDIKKYFKEVTE
jgi:predicted RNA-binding Zn-ribbon protein involved in translation (DUF1610 family)